MKNPIERHDGQAVRERLLAMGWTIPTFAERLQWPERTLYRKLDRKEWTAIDLHEVSRILGWDFLGVYRLERPGEGWLFVPDEVGGMIRLKIDLNDCPQ